MGRVDVVISEVIHLGIPAVIVEVAGGRRGGREEFGGGGGWSGARLSETLRG